jgi:hypothetical protein
MSARACRALVPFSVVATIMGWSASTTVRMSRRYGHIGQSSQRQAVNALNAAGFQGDGHRIGHNLKSPECGNLLTD